MWHDSVSSWRHICVCFAWKHSVGLSPILTELTEVTVSTTVFSHPENSGFYFCCYHCFIMVWYNVQKYNQKQSVSLHVYGKFIIQRQIDCSLLKRKTQKLMLKVLYLSYLNIVPINAEFTWRKINWITNSEVSLMLVQLWTGFNVTLPQ